MFKSGFSNKLSGDKLAFQPLYKQVQEHVTQLIVEQRWKPGEVLPNEFQLADELGVSQGTVRKALNALTDAKVLTRRQGVGTFVSEHAGQPALYRFFPIVADNSEPELPEAQTLLLQLEPPSQEAAHALNLSTQEQILHLRRRRLLNNEACIIEDIYLPPELFAGLIDQSDIPHTLYHFYQTEFGQTIHTTTDKIKAERASQEDAELLDIPVGEPVLQFIRLATNLEGRPMEYRNSRCRSDHYHYLVDTK